ncbi:MAG: MBL fold metallo-hydrolase [Planctomycetes bacterium]|nr:MBL fold metallo-hydrolase [Planctomycetota bacterium]
MGTVTITVVCDNYSVKNDLQTGHGFACYVAGLEKTILFDTGWSGPALRENMQKLGFSFADVDVLVLSHMHGDHTGGVGAVLDSGSPLTIYLPGAVPDRLKEEIITDGNSVVEAEETDEVCPGAWTTGVLKAGLREHALCIETDRGPFVITGCAHPGINNLASEAGDICGFPVYGVLGGFHLSASSRGSIEGIIEELREMGVEIVAPCHCSGNRAREIFQEAYGENYYASGVGWKFEFEKTKTEASNNR